MTPEHPPVSPTDYLSRHDVFQRLASTNHGNVTKELLINTLKREGIQANDPRVKAMLNEFNEFELTTPITFDEFRPRIQSHRGIIERAIKRSFIIPDFAGFCEQITDVYHMVSGHNEGAVATYIPQLARVNPNQFGVSICTVDGQVFNLGDFNELFCVQSVCKPISYALALEEKGEDYVHRFVGREPSGERFNHLSLNKSGLPHNPMINAGAIGICTMIKQELNLAERFDFVLQKWQELSAGKKINLNNSVYLSERETADRNFAIGYFLRENKALPENSNLLETLEFYFQSCSIEITCESLSMVAATLANGGICPATNETVFRPEVVKDCLSLMSSCGMYDFSGEFAFSVGLPAKSGVSGALLLVVPNLLGIALWSPRLDETGNSVKGVAFCQELVKRFNFHRYENIIRHGQKVDPRLQKNVTYYHNVVALCWAAVHGDNHEIARLVAYDVNVNDADYDGRTALHLAASQGHESTVCYLLSLGADPKLIDRWGHTPADDARREGHEEVAKLLS